MGRDSPEHPHGPFWCRTLGGLALYGDPGDPQPLMEAGKPLAALVYVALAPGGRAKRDHIAELLWPGADLTEARHSLRQSLYRLRHATAGVPLVRLRGAELELAHDVRLDCVEAERVGSDGDLPRAYELLRGGFLDGFSVPESRDFESWAETERIRFRDAWGHAARTLAERCLAGGNASRALDVAEDLAAVQPFNDEPVHLVMAALAAAGRHAGALARYHAHVELLSRELDADPGKELAAYARELESGVRSRREPSATDLPFVGRVKEWAALDAAWGGVRGGRGAMVLLEGAAGLGKSRLIQELSRRVEAAGGVLLAGKCYDVERAVPYGAVADGLAPIVGRSEVAGLSPAWLAEAARLFPELRERFPGVPHADDAGGSPAAKRRLHQSLARLLEAVAEEAPVLVAVDDLHWADGPSLEVLHFLGHRLHEAKVLLVGSYRPAELSPVARQFARSLCGAELADLLVLEPLASDDVAELLDRLGCFDDPGTRTTVAEHLERHTGGNPLFLSEVLDALARNRVLRVRDGRWEIGSQARIAELPHTLGKLMADRIDALAPWMRACLETLAVAAAETPVEELAKVLQVSEPRAELALAVLQEDRLVRRSGADGFELVHDELRRLVYQGIPDDRRRLLHAAVATALESRGEAKRPGGAARLAFHFDQAGFQEPAHRYALAAAGEAEALAAPGERRAHLEMAGAHAPKALPPVARVRPKGLRGFVRRHGLVAASAALLALLSAGAGYLFSPALGNAPEWRQGTIYFADRGATAPSHRLRWPARRGQLARVEALRGPRPGDPTPLIHRSVTDRNETHSKVFAIRGKDTVQLTFGLSDDMGAQWAPDGSRFLFIRGWRASETRYQQNLFLADSSGRVLRALTDSPWQDSEASWSSSGAHFAFSRDSAGLWSIWIADADGANPLDVSERFHLPPVPGFPSFAPDDRHLAVLYPDTGSGQAALLVVDLAERVVRRIRGIPPAAVGRPLWSPDGRWVAFAVKAGDRHRLWVIPADEPGVPVVVAEFASALWHHEWSSGKHRYAATVALEPPVIRLRTGRGHRAVARVLSLDGRPVHALLRWSVGDTSIAQVDDLGFVRGRNPGATVLVASAGGFRADTGVVTVTNAVVDTLFVEDWTRGLDTTRWLPFGHPKPVIVEHVAPDERSAFLNNGDYNHNSGAVSVERFEVGEEGLTIEVEVWLAFTGQHWQHLRITLADKGGAGNPEVRGGSPVSMGFDGQEPTSTSAQWSCAGAQMPGEPPAQRWLRVALTVRPDGWCECWVDGRRIGLGPVPDGYVEGPLAVVLLGLSVGTELYHGRVVVRRGVMY